MSTKTVKTLDDVKRRVQGIAAVAGDDEVAHSREDDLHQDVLRAVAAGHPDSGKLARAALRTRRIMFKRWYA